MTKHFQQHAIKCNVFYDDASFFLAHSKIEKYHRDDCDIYFFSIYV